MKTTFVVVGSNGHFMFSSTLEAAKKFLINRKDPSHIERRIYRMSEKPQIESKIICRNYYEDSNMLKIVPRNIK